MVHSLTSPSTYIPIESPEDDLISLVRLILQVEGLSGFFGGVRAMMIGQALIKSVAFSANEMALRLLTDSSDGTVMVASVVEENSGAGASFTTLLLAASFSGFITSFLVAPVGEFKKLPWWSCCITNHVRLHWLVTFVTPTQNKRGSK
jgi:solute carrier family 25 carnitine/acylcarnitine transporter 20/29